MNAASQAVATWWRQTSGAFLRTGNLVALTIFSLAFFLTIDWMLLVAGLTTELIVIGWAARSPSDPARVPAARIRDPLDLVLLVVTVSGFVIILFFGFGKHLLNHRWPYFTHAEGWEAGAILWTGLFLFYYLVKFRATDKLLVDKLIIVSVAGMGLALLILAWNSIGNWSHHIPYIFAIGACFFIIDLLSMRFHPERKERLLSRNSFWWADVPMLVAFGTLWIYLLIHRDTENPDVFVSGVISCQLLISNSAFVVMEFGLLKSPHEVAQLQ